jgi:predicted O-linked N-acetylglucosamine transferase (SPINDLY family)
MVPRLRDLLKPKKSRSGTRPPSVAGTAISASRPAWDDVFQHAQSLQQQGQLDEAIAMYGDCIERAPERAEAYYKRANVLNGLGRLNAALEDYDRAISLNSSYAHALCNRGSVLERLGRLDEALASYDHAIELDPGDALTHYNRGSVLKELERFEEALASYDTAIEVNGGFVEAYVNRGSVLKDLKRFEEALVSYETAIGLNANFAEAHLNRAHVLQELRRHEVAIESFERAIALRPIAQALYGRGVSLHVRKRLDQARRDYSEAIALQPDFAAAYYSRGNLLAEIGRHDEAAVDYLKATELAPDAARYLGLASCAVRLKRFDLAIASLDKAMLLEPDGKYLLGISRATKMQACRWDGLDEDLERIARGVSEGKPVCSPMTLAALMDSPALQRSAAEIFVQDQVHGSHGEELGRIAAEFPARFRGARSAKIRVGYFSGDFRTHPVAHLTAGLFEHHDRAKFEVTAFAFGPLTNDAILSRLTKAFDRFIDVRQKSDFEVIALARDLGIDIAVDLSGFTDYCRTKIFAGRAAPIQINFLGYPGTMGADFMDYLVADGTVVPREQQAHYVEKIAYLPGSFLPFDSSYAIAPKVYTREELGLPSGAVVLCCFNNSYKILPKVFDGWMRILSRIENAVLWLQQADATVMANLREEASRRGVDGMRLVFAERVASLPEHLARLRAADLFLDTFPYTAHATALDALWAGLPLLTCPGESFASRVAASLLRSVGLPELIAASPPQYEDKALELAKDPVRLSQLRRTLALKDTLLFDTERYARNLEAVYLTICERHRSGLPAEHINNHLAA